MGFTTKLDYSNNRQIKQHIETLTALSGGTIFGTPFANLTKGPNTSTSGITEDLSGGISTFSGNNTTTIFNWFDSRMSIGEPSLSAITNDIDSQDVLPIFQSTSTIVIDGNVINTSFTGITFNIVPIDFIDLGSGNYSGNVVSNYCDILSASTAEFTGRTIWVDVSGITRTEKLIVSNNPQVGYVLTCDDIEGMATWSPSGGGTGSTGPDTYVTGGTYNAGTAVFTNSTGGTFNVSGWRFSGGTGVNSQASVNGNNIAFGDYSTATGINTRASGYSSHAEGRNTIASGDYSHAEGYYSTASGDYSHAEGEYTTASGNDSHAEGYYSTASGNYSHAQGRDTTAIGDYSNAEGQNTIASGKSSHAGGYISRANGINSFVHGSGSTVNGNNSVVLGRNITGNTADTTYVDNLNIKTLAVGTSVNNLGIDSTGKVIIGSIGGSGSTSYWSAGTGTNAIAIINNDNIASGNYSIGEGRYGQAIGNYSHTEGFGGYASGDYSHTQGNGTNAYGLSSHAEGTGTQAGGDYSHAEGSGSTTNNFASHAEGFGTLASGQISHAEGNSTIASGSYSHSQGIETISSGESSHAEGRGTIAGGNWSHAGGVNSIASGETSFVHGNNSQANSNNSIVLGRNITGSTADTTYVDSLNIKTVGSGPGTIDLGVNASGVVVNQASDIRLKENINTIENALDKIMNLRGVTYNWIDRINGGDDLRLGFIAQEVQGIVPELITNNGSYLGVQYKDVPALLVEAIKELVSGNSQYSKTYLETQTILAEDNNIELNYNGTTESSIGGGIKIIRGEEESTNLSLDENGDWISNVNIFSKGFVIPEYTPTSTKDISGIIGNIVQDDDYIYIKRQGGWKRTPKLEEF